MPIALGVNEKEFSSGTPIGIWAAAGHAAASSDGSLKSGDRATTMIELFG